VNSTAKPKIAKTRISTLDASTSGTKKNKGKEPAEVVGCQDETECNTIDSEEEALLQAKLKYEALKELHDKRSQTTSATPNKKRKYQEIEANTAPKIASDEDYKEKKLIASPLSVVERVTLCLKISKQKKLQKL